MASANGPVKSEPSDYDATIAIPDHRDILTKEVEQVIFRGTFGKRPVCIKRINLTNDDYVRDEKWRADDFYKNEDHKSFIEEKVLFYLGYHEVHPDYLYIAMDEFHCTLEQIIEIKREYGHIRRLFVKDSALVIDILRQIADGIKCLHSIDTPHGDLRPANVVVMPLAGDEKQNVQIKLANLRRTKPSADYLLSGWAGPEVFHSPKPCLASDIFSLGCIFAYVMTDGDHPFGNDNLKRVANIVTNKPKKDYLAKIDNTALGKLISAMIIKKHDERPNITWITGKLAKLSLTMIKSPAVPFFELSHWAKLPSRQKFVEGNFKIKRICATLNWENLHGGKPTGKNSSKGKTDDKDDSSHLIAKVLGGASSLKSNNIVYLREGINRGVYKLFEEKLKNFIVSNPDTKVHLNVIIDEDEASESRYCHPKTLRFVWCSGDGKTFFASPLIENTLEYVAKFRKELSGYQQKGKDIWSTSPPIRGSQVITLGFQDELSNGQPSWDEKIMRVIAPEDRQDCLGQDNSDSHLLYVPTNNVKIADPKTHCTVQLKVKYENVEIKCLQIPNPRSRAGRNLRMPDYFRPDS